MAWNFYLFILLSVLVVVLALIYGIKTVKNLVDNPKNQYTESTEFDILGSPDMNRLYGIIALAGLLIISLGFLLL